MSMLPSMDIDLDREGEQLPEICVKCMVLHYGPHVCFKDVKDSVIQKRRQNPFR